MPAAISHETVKSSAETPSSSAKKSRGEGAVSQPEFNPLWHRLALGVKGCAFPEESAWRHKPTAGAGINASGLQTKLTIGASGDRYELEADRIADRIMQLPAAAIQTKST